jgi:hypothetical protein
MWSFCLLAFFGSAPAEPFFRSLIADHLASPFFHELPFVRPAGGVVELSVAPFAPTVLGGHGAQEGCNCLRRARWRASRVLGMPSVLGVKVPCAT